MKEIFTNIVKTGYWRAHNTLCGNGSTLAVTENLRKQLAPFLQRYKINSMFDAACGDYSWMSQTQLPAGLEYIGGDIVESLIEKNRQQYPGVDFRLFDITQDAFPKVDLVFCRACLIHLSHADIHRVFENIVRSSVQYLMLSNHPRRDNTDIPTGDFRGVDFRRAPYSFNSAIDSIEDCVPGLNSKLLVTSAMCLWSRDTLITYLKQGVNPCTN
jgi:SAM-dependent methyltransferase